MHANNHYVRFQYTTMLIVIIEASFMHHMSVLSPELSRYYLITRRMANFIQHTGESSSMREAHGGADRSLRRDVPRKHQYICAWSYSRTDRARSDAPAGMCRPRTLAHTRR